MPTRQRLILSTVAMLVTAVVAGLVWLWLAHPAEWEVRANGIVLTEAAARDQFSVIVVFVLVGAVASIVWATLATVLLPELGWFVTPFVIVATLVGAVLAWRLGVWLGPPSPGSVTGTSVGDRLPSRLAVDGLTPFLVWPIFGLVGVLVTTWVTSRRHADDETLSEPAEPSRHW